MQPLSCFYLSDFPHIFFPIKIFHNPRYRLRHSPAYIGIIPAILDGFQEGHDLVADALAVQLVEVALVVGGIFVANLEVVGLPPGSRDVDVSSVPETTRSPSDLMPLPTWMEAMASEYTKFTLENAS